MQIFKVHEGVVEDVAWHLSHEYLFGLVGDDQYLHVWDLRTPSADKPIQSEVGHQSEVHMHNSKFRSPFCIQEHRVHTDAPIHPYSLWPRIDEEQTPEDVEDGPFELVFIHGGHTSKISDVSWIPCEDWVVASVAEDNILQIW